MPDEDYSDAPAQAPAPAPSDGGDPDEGGEDSQTGLLPKAVLGGKELKPGDTCTLEIVADHGDEYEVRYAEDAGNAEKPAEEPAAAPAPGGMESMLQD